jgi:hypothetical protein
MHEKVTTQNGFTIESAESNFIVIWINFHPGWGHNRTLSFRELNKGTKQKSGLEHYSRPRSQRTLTIQKLRSLRTPDAAIRFEDHRLQPPAN